jgi:hypothetical protein
MVAAGDGRVTPWEPCPSRSGTLRPVSACSPLAASAHAATVRPYRRPSLQLRLRLPPSRPSGRSSSRPTRSTSLPTASPSSRPVCAVCGRCLYSIHPIAPLTRKLIPPPMTAWPARYFRSRAARRPSFRFSNASEVKLNRWTRPRGRAAGRSRATAALPLGVSPRWRPFGAPGTPRALIPAHPPRRGTSKPPLGFGASRPPGSGR